MPRTFRYFYTGGFMHDCLWVYARLPVGLHMISDGFTHDCLWVHSMPPMIVVATIVPLVDFFQVNV